ncbi:hypothetical protein MMPV_008506 [Pyropia vietnamensis]
MTRPPSRRPPPPLPPPPGSTPASLLRGAVGGIFHRWTALGLAVTEGYGGPSSVAIAADLADATAGALLSGVDVDGLTTLLYDGFEAFKTDVEDGSVEAVADQLVRIRRALAGGDAAPALAAAASTGTARNRQRGVDRSVRAPRPTGGEEESGASSDEDGGRGSGGNDAMDVEQSGGSSRPPRLPPPPPPEVDTDGFQTVAPRRRRR